MSDETPEVEEVVEAEPTPKPKKGYMDFSKPYGQVKGINAGVAAFAQGGKFFDVNGKPCKAPE